MYPGVCTVVSTVPVICGHS